MSVRNPWAATNANTCTACCNVFCRLKFTLRHPLEWARAHFATPVPETNAKVRHYVVVVEADWLGLRLSLRDLAGGKSELLVPQMSSGAVSCNRSSTRCCP